MYSRTVFLASLLILQSKWDSCWNHQQMYRRVMCGYLAAWAPALCMYAICNMPTEAPWLFLTVWHSAMLANKCDSYVVTWGGCEPRQPTWEGQTATNRWWIRCVKFSLGRDKYLLGMMDELTHYFSGFESNHSIPKRTPVINCTYL